MHNTANSAGAKNRAADWPVSGATRDENDIQNTRNCGCVDRIGCGVSCLLHKVRRR